MGISGSVQHMAGMKHVPNIIAVNTDREASIFTIAHYGVVADVFDIAGELKNHFD
jgi:electron transfer flavoprotein alpha subunit